MNRPPDDEQQDRDPEADAHGAGMLTQGIREDASDRCGATPLAHEPGAYREEQPEQESAPGHIHEQRGGYRPDVVRDRMRVRGVSERVRDD